MNSDGKEAVALSIGPRDNRIRLEQPRNHLLNLLEFLPHNDSLAQGRPIQPAALPPTNQVGRREEAPAQASHTYEPATQNGRVEKELAASLARRLGLSFDEAVLLGEGTNVLFHLRPAPVVARVTRLAHLVRPPEALAGGVGLAKALGKRAVPPSALIDPGPHLEGGRYITFWTYRTGRSASAEEAGAALRAFHEAAAPYPGVLRSFDPRPEALRIADLVGGEASEILRDAASRLVPPALPEQAIHGDAHFENVLAGGVWQDFDEACFGPREWDVACMIHRWAVFGELEREMRAALAVYGAYDHEAVEALQPLVVLGIAAWGSLAPLLGESSPRTADRLAWLRRH
jgi:Ser/Thr protein kinase RdoA (MazF antagonist)